MITLAKRSYEIPSYGGQKGTTDQEGRRKWDQMVYWCLKDKAKCVDQVKKKNEKADEFASKDVDIHFFKR